MYRQPMMQYAPAPRYYAAPMPPQYDPRYGGYAPEEEYYPVPSARYGGNAVPSYDVPLPPPVDRSAGYSGFHLNKNCTIKARTKRGKSVRVPKKSQPPGFRARQVACKARFEKGYRRSYSQVRRAYDAKLAAKKALRAARSASKKAADALKGKLYRQRVKGARRGGAAEEEVMAAEASRRAYQYTLGPRGGVLRNGGGGWRSVSASQVPERVLERLGLF